MIIKELKDIKNFQNFLPVDKNGRLINIYTLNNVQIVNIHYPNCLLYSNGELYNPLDERIMSLQSVERDKNFYFEEKKELRIEKNPVFYFIYNTDNYYHFIYDTLPFLISYNHLKKQIKDIKLLMQSNNLYPFVREFLEIMNISKNDILIADDNMSYEKIYISSSYTHGIDSNLPPRDEIYDMYKNIVSTVDKNENDKIYPKKIYISRRTWLHNDFSNIGTNYTNRRKLINEDRLVDHLIKNGYQEIFTENLSTIDKIKLFSNVENVIGSIGGGICNVLFSKKDTKLIAIISPTFLDINSRFIFSLNRVNVTYYNKSWHVEKDEWKKFIRVKTKDNIIGEIENVLNDELLISYSDEPVAGWNSQIKFNKKLVKKADCVKLDNGLNSLWEINIEEINI